jgi:hypothetical protein
MMHGWRRPVRLIVAAILFVVVLPVHAWAQRGLEDVTRACPRVTPDLVKVAAASVMGRCPVFCSGCGCKGGPGYRAPANNNRKGGCVGYADIISKCGVAPHDTKGCVRECARVVVACLAFGRTRLKEAAKSADIEIIFDPTELPDDNPEEEEDTKPPTPIVPSVSAPATTTKSP